MLNGGNTNGTSCGSKLLAVKDFLVSWTFCWDRTIGYQQGYYFHISYANKKLNLNMQQLAMCQLNFICHKRWYGLWQGTFFIPQYDKGIHLKFLHTWQFWFLVWAKKFQNDIKSWQENNILNKARKEKPGKFFVGKCHGTFFVMWRL